MILLDHVTSDTVGISRPINNRTEVLVIEGNFAGGTVTVEAKTENTNWQQLRNFDGTPATFTENTITNITELKAVVFTIRAILSGATAGAANLVVELF